MFINENNKYTTAAEYFYNDYNGLYCVVGTTISMEYLDELMELWESADLLTEIAIPEYITEDYDGSEW